MLDFFLFLPIVFSCIGEAGDRKFLKIPIHST
jgi:hypothetical protein